MRIGFARRAPQVPPNLMAARSGGVNHENIFIAKTHDSESARPRFCASQRLTIVAFSCRVRRAKIQETLAAQGFAAILTNADVGRSGVSRIAISTHCLVI